MSTELRRLTAELKSWLIDAALPFWANTAIDAQGGFYEHLKPDGSPDRQAIRRLRVQARQIDVYSLATHLGWYDGKDIACAAFDFMCDKGLSPDGKPGFIHLLGPDYTVVDDKRDFYDHTFYLLACASLYKAFTHKSAYKTIDHIKTLLSSRMTSPHGGWRESIPPTLPRRQNPHMHYFEANMALYKATSQASYLETSQAIYHLFEQYFFDPENKCIREFFTEDWHAAPGTAGKTVEPGHGAEWVWLLHMYQSLSSADTSTYRHALYQRLNLSNTRLYDEEDIHQSPRRTTTRLWVQTEWVRAHLTQITHDDPKAEHRAVACLRDVKDHYLQDKGTWIDQFDAEGHPIATTIPTSTLYHIMGMITHCADIIRAN